MKRIVSLLLCLLMLLAALSSCGNKTGDENNNTQKQARPNLTLKFAIVVDDIAEDEADFKAGIQAMSDKFNEYTMQKYSTAIEFYCYTEDEYETELDKIMAGIKSGDMSGQAQGTQASAEGYPTARLDQFDLVVITNEAMYKRYIENGYITCINDQLSKDYKVITTMIHGEVMKTALVNNYSDEGVLVSEDKYGIPASKTIGSYTYLAVNKEILSYYHFNENEVTDFSFAYKLWETVKNDTDSFAFWKNRFGDGYTHIWNDEADFLYPNVRYLSMDGSESLLGVLYEPSSTISSWNGVDILTPMNLLTDNKYSAFVKLRQQAKSLDAFGTAEAGADFMMGIVEGDYGLRNSDSDYYYCPLNLPTLERENVFAGMLAVSSYSVNVNRSVEIIQGLMTDANLLNTLLFGGTDTNYIISNDGVLSFRNSSNYAMAQKYMVGNMVALAYPCADYGQSATYYTDARAQNLQSAPALFDATLASHLAKVDAEEWAYFDAAMNEYMAELNACTNIADLEAKIAEINAELTVTAETSAEDIAARLFKMLGNTVTGTLGKHFFDYVQSKS